MNSIFCLIKFGKKEHLESLRDKGQMRFGLLTDFQTSTERERGDKFETAVNIVNGQFTKIEWDHPELGRHTFKLAPNSLGTIINFTNDPYFCFSSYALTSNCFKNGDNHKIDKKMLAFGEYALVINEPIIFLEQVKNKLSPMGINFGYKLTDYKNYKKEGDIETNLFSKTSDLSHQFEHRILVRTETNKEAIFIEIGSIEDFCFLSRADEIIQTKFKAKRKSNEGQE